MPISYFLSSGWVKLNCTYASKKNRRHGAGIPVAAFSRNGSTVNAFPHLFNFLYRNPLVNSFFGPSGALRAPLLPGQEALNQSSF
jgi:hypothetical protein